MNRLLSLLTAVGIFASFNLTTAQKLDFDPYDYYPTSVYDANSRLMAMMGRLYTEVDFNDLTSENLDGIVQWMDNFRSNLCKYYRDSHGSPDIPDYDIADSVMSEVDRLWDSAGIVTTVDCHQMTFCNLMVEAFVGFNEYARLQSTFKSEELKAALRSEMAAWLDLQKTFANYAGRCARLSFWNGSFAGVISTDCMAETVLAHNKMYRADYSALQTKNAVNAEQASLEHKKNVLDNCIAKALHDATEYNDSEYDLNPEVYQNCVSETEKLGAELNHLIQIWIDARQMVEKTATKTGAPTLRPNSARLLTDLADLISGIHEIL